MRHHQVDPASSPSQAGSFVRLLRAQADARPEQIGYSFLADGEADESSLTYAALDQLSSSPEHRRFRFT